MLRKGFLQEKVNFDRFDVIDYDSSYFRLQIKAAMYINCNKPKINKQVRYVGITSSM